MIIHLNENTLNKLFLVESKNSDRAHRQTRELIAQFLGRAVDDPEVISDEQAFEKKLFGEGLRTDWFITLEPYAYNWCRTAGFFGIDGVAKILNYLFRKAQTVNRPEFMKQVKSFQTFTEIRNFVGENQKADRVYARENGTKQNNLNTNYQVLGPLSFEEAKKYGDYSGWGAGQSGRICYSQSESTWLSSYYSNHNTNNCFILLRNDWNEVSSKHDGSEANNGLPKPLNQYNGYDNYGLSMIFVWVNPNGELHECNTRWNHEARYAPGRSVDLALTQTDIEKIMGVPFEEIFNSSNFYDKADDSDNRLANGEDIRTVYDYVEPISSTLSLVELSGKYNIFSDKEKRLLFPHDWFSGIGTINEFNDLVLSYNNGFAFLINFKELCDFYEYTNIIENRLKEGFKPRDLFSYVLTFGQKFGLVGFTSRPIGNSKIDFQSVNIYNFETEKLMSYNWADSGNLSIEGSIILVRLRIGRDYKYNFLAKDSNRLLLDAPVEEWYDGFRTLRLNGQICIKVMSNIACKDNIAMVKDDGNIGFIFDQDFEDIDEIWSIITKEGECIFLEITDDGFGFYGDCYGNIYKTDLEFINGINKIIADGNNVDFPNFYRLFTNDGNTSKFAKVKFNHFEENKYNIYDIVNKKLILPNFVDDLSLITSDGLFIIEIDGKANITYLGEKMLLDLPFKEWPNTIIENSSGTKMLFSIYWEDLGDEGYGHEWCNIMDINGNLLLKENCESMTQFINGVCVIENKDGKFNFFDEDLNPLFENGFDEIDMYEFEDENVGFVHCTLNKNNSSKRQQNNSPTFFSKVNHKLITKDGIEKLFYDYLSNGYGSDIVYDIVNEFGDHDVDEAIKVFNDDVLLNGRDYFVANEEIDNWLYKWFDYFVDKHYYEFFDEEDEI